MHGSMFEEGHTYEGLLFSVPVSFVLMYAFAHSNNSIQKL